MSNLRKQIGMVFQGSALFDSMTVEENIMFPMQMFTKKDDDEVREGANQVIKRVNLINANEKYPDEISGGMKKRVAIARSLISNPEILIADEPTGTLDKRNSEDVIKLLFKLKKDFGSTLILVTHDTSVAKLCDKIIKIDNGLIAE